MQGKAMAAEEDEEEEDGPKQKSITEVGVGPYTRDHAVSIPSPCDACQMGAA
jgi:hypothetical protein